MNEKSNYFTNTFPAGREASEMYYQLQQRAALRLPEITLLLSKLDTNTKKKKQAVYHTEEKGKWVHCCYQSQAADSALCQSLHVKLQGTDATASPPPSPPPPHPPN